MAAASNSSRMSALSRGKLLSQRIMASPVAGGKTMQGQRAQAGVALAGAQGRCQGQRTQAQAIWQARAFRLQHPGGQARQARFRRQRVQGGVVEHKLAMRAVRCALWCVGARLELLAE